MQVTASDPTATQATNTAKSRTSPDYIWNVLRFGSLMNMAQPDNASIDQTVKSPHLKLSKYSYANPFATQTPAFAPGARMVDMDTTYEGMAKAVARELGDGQTVTLDDAMKALDAGRTNTEETIAAYFSRLDQDKSGTLSVAELTTLFNYKDEHDDDPLRGPRLPVSWV